MIIITDLATAHDAARIFGNVSAAGQQEQVTGRRRKIWVVIGANVGVAMTSTAAQVDAEVSSRPCRRWARRLNTRTLDYGKIGGRFSVGRAGIPVLRYRRAVP